jgi:hypothetical protein
MFWLRLAHLARETGHVPEARRALERLEALPGLPDPIRRAARSERAALERGR